MEAYLQTWGYIAAFIGTMLEGEILLISSIIAAKMGFMQLYGTLIAVFSGAFIRDGITFFIARKKGKQLIDNRPRLKAKFEYISGQLERHPIYLLLSARMFYGFTTVIVILFGTSSSISWKKFALLSALGTAIWVSFYGILAYYFAAGITDNIKWIGSHKLLFLGILSSIGMGYWFFVKRKDLMHKKNNS